MNSDITNDNQENQQEKTSPPNPRFFPVALFGLPLNRSDNFKCLLVVMLTVSLQIRMADTFLAEGWIALGGLIGFALMRYWLLGRRYPDSGEVRIDDQSISFPGSVHGGIPVTVSLEEIKSVTFFYFKNKGNEMISSVIFKWPGNRIKVNWLGIDLNGLERALEKVGQRTQRELWNPAYRVIGIMVAIGFLISLATFIYDYFN
ncbi:MAG: hypothetical protein ACOYXC_17850 [Candidatus Rifleibacteriota bacterium]